MTRAWPVAFGALLLGGCPGGRAGELAGEALRLSEAVRSLRDAPNPDKRPWLERLAETPCTSADLCELRATCLAGYRQHGAAFSRVEALSRTLDASQADQTARSLANAQLELEAAHERVTECARVEAEIRTKYRL